MLNTVFNLFKKKEQPVVKDTGMTKEAAYLEEKRKQAKEYLKDKWLLHPKSCYKGNFLRA